MAVMNISIVDVDHSDFVDIVNKANVTKQGYELPEEIWEVLDEMIDYAWNHFKAEETHMMRKLKYQDYNQHKKEHLDFVVKTFSFFSRVANGDYRISNEILEYLKQWLVNHILGTDKKHRVHIE